MKQIPGFNGYYIAEDGSVYSNRKNKDKLIKLRLSLSKHGYLYASMYDNNKKHFLKSVHRLVATAYILKENGRDQVNHKDGNKLNNSADNLEWVTASENLNHAHRLGLKSAAKGEASGTSKLTIDQVSYIRSLPKTTPNGINAEFTNRQLANQYGVSESQISRIRNNKQWQ